MSRVSRAAICVKTWVASVNAYDRKHKPKNPFALPRKLPPRVAQENRLATQENLKGGTGELFTPYRRIEKVPQENRLPTPGESATVLRLGRH